MLDSIIPCFISELQDFIHKVDYSTYIEMKSSSRKTIDLSMPLSKLEDTLQNPEGSSNFHESYLNNVKKIGCQKVDVKESKKENKKKSKVKPKWNETHDKFLLNTVYCYSCNWKKIQMRIYKKYKIKVDVSFLKDKYSQLKPVTEQKKGKFSPAEDQRFLELIEIYGKNWIKISNFFEGRNPITMKNHYYYLNKSKESLNQM